MKGSLRIVSRLIRHLFFVFWVNIPNIREYKVNNGLNYEFKQDAGSMRFEVQV